MELNNHILLIIWVSYLILSLSANATELSPSPSPAPTPISYVSSSPDGSPAPTPISSVSSSPAPTPVSHVLSSLSPEHQPASISYVSSSPSPSFSKEGESLFDDDVTMALESRINQGASDSKLAIEEAKKLLNDPTIAASETGECLRQCVDNYGASLDDLNRAVEDLGIRDASLLIEDFSSVEADIAICQKCFTENLGEDSPLKDLEEAATKAARDCLTVLDYSR